MPSIVNLRLELDESQGAAAALVTYGLRGNLRDVQQQIRYIEVVQLIGDDKGEGGLDDLIPGGPVFANSFVFTNTALITRPPRLHALPSSALDEDPGNGPFQFPKEDEIRARVTLTRVEEQVAAESNLVRRGGFTVPDEKVVIAAPA